MGAREVQAARIARYKREGLCISCGEPTDSKVVRCLACLEQRRIERDIERGLRLERGRCGTGACQSLVEHGKTMCLVHLEKMRVRSKSYLQGRKAAGLCFYGGCAEKKAIGNGGFCEPHYRYRLESAATQRVRVKHQVIAMYGGICACCGESEYGFLTIDHKLGGGAAHRRELKGSSSITYYRSLLKEFRPDLYQVLCMNCNWGSRLTGVCPHQKIWQRRVG